DKVGLVTHIPLKSSSIDELTGRLMPTFLLPEATLSSDSTNNIVSPLTKKWKLQKKDDVRLHGGTSAWTPTDLSFHVYRGHRLRDLALKARRKLKKKATYRAKKLLRLRLLYISDKAKVEEKLRAEEEECFPGDEETGHIPGLTAGRKGIGASRKGSKTQMSYE
ncbi:hypothetical protein HAX54_037590, partial [Datura stramonium]|nr:hypothetical protein [Datura stramonium]